MCRCGENHVNAVYVWEDSYAGWPTVMVAAFRWHNKSYGESFSIDRNFVRKNMDKKKLVTKVRDTLNVLLSHGEEVLDSNGDIDPKKFNDLEARRFWLDPSWGAKTKTIRDSIIMREITREQAVRLGMLSEPKSRTASAVSF